MRSSLVQRLSDVLARALVGVLFVFLCVNIFKDFERTHRITGLLLLVSEALVVILTIFRRKATVVDWSPAASAVTLLSLVGPPLLRSNNTAGMLPDLLTAAISSAGLLIVIAGKLTLGRSFGIVPANRGVVDDGPYLFVRHPIYTGYVLTHAGFLMAYPTAWNIAIVLIADAALIVRALYEERVLGGDERYRAYCTRVGWHLLPGVF